MALKRIQREIQNPLVNIKFSINILHISEDTIYCHNLSFYVNIISRSSVIMRIMYKYFLNLSVTVIDTIKTRYEKPLLEMFQ